MSRPDPPLDAADPVVADLIHQEGLREFRKFRLIPSENYASRAVLEAVGSVLTNKYSEGYAGKRYYEGQQIIDQVEELASSRLQGAVRRRARQRAAVLRQPGEPRRLPRLLQAGRRRSWASGCRRRPPHARLERQHHGQLLQDHPLRRPRDTTSASTSTRCASWPTSTGRSSCGRAPPPTRALLDFAEFREIADECGAILCADIAHIAGLVAGGAHPSPVGIADVVTTTTHKTLRGPRGGIIMCKAEHAKAIDRAVFPGLQGGPHNHTTAGIAVAAKEASTPEFKQYAQNVVSNAKVLAEALLRAGLRARHRRHRQSPASCST